MNENIVSAYVNSDTFIGNLTISVGETGLDNKRTFTWISELIYRIFGKIISKFTCKKFYKNFASFSGKRVFLVKLKVT
jgi:hypothetical protein